MQTKDYKIAVRIDKPTLEKLGIIVQKENISQSEAVRKAIDYFYLDLVITEKLKEIKQHLKDLKEIPQKFETIESKIEESKEFLREGILTDIKQTKEIKKTLNELRKEVLKASDFDEYLGNVERGFNYLLIGIGILILLNLVELLFLIKLTLFR